MLGLAIRAQLPLIAVSTTDVLNLPDVLSHIAGKTAQKLDPKKPPMKGGLYYAFLDGASGTGHDRMLYEQMVKAEASLVCVNMKKVPPIFFDAGEVPVPKGLLKHMLVKALGNAEFAAQVMPALGGVTLKDMGELLRLTMVRDKKLTAAGVMQTRRTCGRPTRGLTQVDTSNTAYVPQPGLMAWLKREAKFFLYAADQRLIPRGLLFDGPPGTGKTEGAKYIARNLGVPLYRLDLGTVKQKYVGDSEANLSAAFAQLDHEEPCVVLLDEIEKMLSGTDSSDGVTASMLGVLLWWLQEHKSRVFTIMTTNNKDKLPKELYREGRIDEVMWFGGLTGDAIVQFAKHIANQFPDSDRPELTKSDFETAFSINNPNLKVPQAQIAAWVYKQVKEAILKKLSTTS